jgi:hypothetical protein
MGNDSALEQVVVVEQFPRAVLHARVGDDVDAEQAVIADRMAGDRADEQQYHGRLAVQPQLLARQPPGGEGLELGETRDAGSWPRRVRCAHPAGMVNGSHQQSFPCSTIWPGSPAVPSWTRIGRVPRLGGGPW